MVAMKTASLKGVSGDNYSFKVYDVDIKFTDEISVIYCFAKQDEILYVGQTENLQQRMRDHEKLPLAKKLGCKYILVMETPEDELNSVELDIAAYYNPQLNVYLTN